MLQMFYMNERKKRMIKIQAQRRAFYNGEIIRAGQILDITSNKVPSWAKRIGKETPNEDGKAQNKEEQKSQTGEQQQLDINSDANNAAPEEDKKEEETETPDEDAAGDESTDETEEDVEVIPEDLVGKTDKEVLAILDGLITKGIEIGVMIEDADKKTPIEQIIELRKLIEEKKQ